MYLRYSPCEGSTSSGKGVGFRTYRYYEPCKALWLQHDLVKIFGIHLFLAGLACFGFGAFHVTGLYGPGIWVSDPYGLTGKVQSVNPAWGVEGFDPFVPGGIASHHIAAVYPCLNQEKKFNGSGDDWQNADKIATPSDQLPRIDEQLARSHNVVAKYSVLQQNDNKQPLDYKDLDQLMLSSFKEQLQHIRVHAMEAVMACQELEQSLQSLAGIAPGEGTGATMSDDEDDQADSLTNLFDGQEKNGFLSSCPYCK
ncbi:hypothetical protein POM88_003086 [Heracleum sosnowskyi]|uniref:KNOX2 domain-containing protein n=1 Tax=Heracleum sosnowskyi TaxID=360622 RepID=A0AAD8JIW7_9APIA|nr:hypothetical protein POM88_003086 [Heracleum sosnowskyi]